MAARHHHLVIRQAQEKKYLDEDVPLALMFDLDAFRLAMSQLKAAFPSYFLHTLAVKSNPTMKILKFALEEGGLGFEAASLGELTQALNTGASSASIVFDSPVKTLKELEYALKEGVHVNIDNFQELERVAVLLKGQPELCKSQWLGMRINPQVGAGSIESHSTASMTSKFGIPLVDQRDELLTAYHTHEWLNAVHVHVGSQGVGVKLAMAGIRAVVDFLLEVNRRAGYCKVRCIDIGGGLGVNFQSDSIPFGFDQYAKALRENVPELFDNSLAVLTEFGRSVVSKAGWFATRVEYTKVAGGRHIAAQHAGADICVRTVYHPETWPLRVTVCDGSGKEKREAESDWKEWDIAGPCCIAGDIIAHRRPLPFIEPNDWLIVHDVGGYYHASYSRYNCRQCPPVIGYEVGADCQVAFQTLQSGETVEESLRMFCAGS